MGYFISLIKTSSDEFNKTFSSAAGGSSYTTAYQWVSDKIKQESPRKLFENKTRREIHHSKEYCAHLKCSDAEKSAKESALIVPVY